jgi:hypothetical protein
MNVVLASPISVLISSAKLVVEDSGRGTIEFTIMNQPVRLNILSTDYTYDIIPAVGDRVKLIENFGAFNVDSQGILQEIIVDNTEDRAKVLFDIIYPDQTIKPVEAHVSSTVTSLLVELPLRFIEKL